MLLGAWRNKRWIVYAAEECAGWIASGLYSQPEELAAGMKIYRDAGGKRRLLRHRIEAEHVQHLPANFRALVLPILQALHAGEIVSSDFTGAAYQVFLEHLIPLLSTARTAAIRLRLGGGERRGGKECRQDQYGSHTGTVL